MNNLDDLAWKREFDRVEANQEKRKSKREGWDGKTPPKVYIASLRTAAWTWTTSHSEQFNEE